MRWNSKTVFSVSSLVPVSDPVQAFGGQSNKGAKKRLNLFKKPSFSVTVVGYHYHTKVVTFYRPRKWLFLLVKLCDYSGKERCSAGHLHWDTLHRVDYTNLGASTQKGSPKHRHCGREMWDYVDKSQICFTFQFMNNIQEHNIGYLQKERKFVKFCSWTPESFGTFSP